jgi:hypothetical protein
MNIPREFDWACMLEKAVVSREQLNRERKVRKLQALIDDSASTEGEKQGARLAIERIQSKLYEEYK